MDALTDRELDHIGTLLLQEDAANRTLAKTLLEPHLETAHTLIHQDQPWEPVDAAFERLLTHTCNFHHYVYHSWGALYEENDQLNRVLSIYKKSMDPDGHSLLASDIARLKTYLNLDDHDADA